MRLSTKQHCPAAVSQSHRGGICSGIHHRSDLGQREVWQLGAAQRLVMLQELWLIALFGWANEWL